MSNGLQIFQVDSFTKTVFSGNPAAVCVVPAWPEERLMQQIAAENNLAETAFLKIQGGEYGLRWFTPKVEVDLCGHATLAAAHVLFNHVKVNSSAVAFNTCSGKISVVKEQDGLLVLDFPVREGKLVPPPQRLLDAINIRPVETYLARDFMMVFNSEDEIRALAPKFENLLQLESFGVIATAPGKSYDFVSRFFAPRVGINEDPVTGSSHCTLVPFWSKRLGKSELKAKQMSLRGGELHCKMTDSAVKIGGFTVTYSEGRLCF